MVPADVALVVRFPSNRRFFNDVFTAYQELFSGEALLTRLINHDGNGNEKIQNKSTSLMSKTKTLNARASYFSGGSRQPPPPSPPRPSLSERLGSALHFWVKFFALRGSRTLSTLIICQCRQSSL